MVDPLQRVTGIARSHREVDMCFATANSMPLYHLPEKRREGKSKGCRSETFDNSYANAVNVALMLTAFPLALARCHLAEREGRQGQDMSA